MRVRVQCLEGTAMSHSIRHNGCQAKSYRRETDAGSRGTRSELQSRESGRCTAISESRSPLREIVGVTIETGNQREERIDAGTRGERGTGTYC